MGHLYPFMMWLVFSVNADNIFSHRVVSVVAYQLHHCEKALCALTLPLSLVAPNPQLYRIRSTQLISFTILHRDWIKNVTASLPLSSKLLHSFFDFYPRIWSVCAYGFQRIRSTPTKTCVFRTQSSNAASAWLSHNPDQGTTPHLPYILVRVQDFAFSQTRWLPVGAETQSDWIALYKGAWWKHHDDHRMSQNVDVSETMTSFRWFGFTYFSHYDYDTRSFITHTYLHLPLKYSRWPSFSQATPSSANPQYHTHQCSTCHQHYDTPDH